MVDAITVVAVALLVGGVVGTVVPLLPGGLLSLAGVYLHWWGSGFDEPGVVWLVVFTIIGASVVVVDLFAGSIAARAGGASWGTTAAAGAVGIVLLLFTGPLGLLAGLFGTVFVLEFVRGGGLEGSARSGLYTVVGVLASTAVQVLLTGSILAGFVLVVFVF